MGESVLGVLPVSDVRIEDQRCRRSSPRDHGELDCHPPDRPVFADNARYLGPRGKRCLLEAELVSEEHAFTVFRDREVKNGFAEQFLP